MNGSDDIGLAEAYVLGTLDGAARRRAEIRIVEDQAFAADARAWERRLAPLALVGEAVLPEGLLDRIEAKITASRVELPGTYTKRAGDGKWHEVTPGFHVRVLGRDMTLRRQTIMLRLAPGTQYQAHDHGQDEEIYMMEGDLEIGSLTLKAGDYHIARAGYRHPQAITRKGCTCIVMQALDD